MKDEDIKHFLQENMQQKAPDNFTINVMDAIQKEAQTKPISNYVLPAKGILFSLATLFIVSMLWAINESASSKIDFSKYTDYIQFTLPKMEFNILLNSNIVMYVCLAFLGFLILDYLVYRNKNVQIVN